MTPQRAREILSSFRGRLAASIGFDRDDFDAIDLAIRTMSEAQSPTQPPAQKRRKLALLIGTNYVGSSNQLGGCLADVAHWKDFASSRGYTCTVVAGQAASRRMMLAVLDELVRTANADLIFQFSGHGTQVPDRNGDEQDGRDEAICPDDFRSAGVIIDDELNETFANLATDSRLVVILDSCHSGSGVRNAQGGEARAIQWDDSIPLPTRATGYRGTVPQDRVTLLAACRDDQTAADTGHSGAFSDAMLATFGIGGTASEWLSRASARLHGQSPVLSGLDFAMREVFA
jgi:hypothetical protein